MSIRHSAAAAAFARRSVQLRIFHSIRMTIRFGIITANSAWHVCNGVRRRRSFTKHFRRPGNITIIRKCPCRNFSAVRMIRTSRNEIFSVFFKKNCFFFHFLTEKNLLPEKQELYCITKKEKSGFSKECWNGWFSQNNDSFIAAQRQNF